MKNRRLVLMLLMVTGCHRSSPETPTGRQIIEAATGKTAVDQYIKTQEQIRKIQEQQKERHRRSVLPNDK